MSDHGIYVQPINYPTVPRGEELLRVAPTPHHTEEMMNKFVNAALSVFLNNGVELSTSKALACEHCKRPMKFEAYESLSNQQCDGNNCDKFLLSCAAQSKEWLYEMVEINEREG